MTLAFRHTAGFGKRIEYYVVGLMLKEGLDVYLPLVDDDAVDAVIKRPDGEFVEVQIKARSKDAILGVGAMFAGVRHPSTRKNYWFVFYAERHDMIFILSSAEFIAEAAQNKTGKNQGTYTLCLNGARKNPETGEREEYIKERYLKYRCPDFSRLLDPLPVRRSKSRAAQTSSGNFEGR